jgi:hypothetical protein
LNQPEGSLDLRRVESLQKSLAWYAALGHDMSDGPLIFVGTRLTESPLWQHLELYGTVAQPGSTMRAQRRIENGLSTDVEAAVPNTAAPRARSGR